MPNIGGVGKKSSVFRPVSHCISETGQDRDIVTTEG